MEQIARGKAAQQEKLGLRGQTVIVYVQIVFKIIVAFFKSE